MSQPESVKGNSVSVIRSESGSGLQARPSELTVLIATVDSTICNSMRELLQTYSLKTIWVKGLNEMRAVLAKKRVAACFCGPWLVDGTYRDAIGLLKCQPVEIPAIVVCDPACTHEYRDYFAALNIRAVDFICYPYRRSDMNRILRAAIVERFQSARLQSSMGEAGKGLGNQLGVYKAV